MADSNGSSAGLPIGDLYVRRQSSEPAPPVEPVPAAKLPPGTYLQYVGFNQAGSVREYLFRRISRGEVPEEFVVNADLSLFTKHRVGIQEGPALCLHFLLGQLAGSGTLAAPGAHSLTEPDMLAHLASHPAQQAKGGSKRVSRFSGAVSGNA